MSLGNNIINLGLRYKYNRKDTLQDIICYCVLVYRIKYKILSCQSHHLYFIPSVIFQVVSCA